jgi:hypothetical protein
MASEPVFFGIGATLRPLGGADLTFPSDRLVLIVALNRASL